MTFTRESPRVYEGIMVGDVPFNVGCRFGSLGLSEVFPTTTERVLGTIDVDIGYILDSSSPAEIAKDHSRMSLVVDDGDGAGVNIFQIFRHLGFMAGLLSKNYSWAHGSGVQVNGKGIMILGKSGSGKSTLASMLGGELLDDDQLLYSHNEIRRLGNVGFKIIPGTGRLQMSTEPPITSPLNYVFYLNNEATAGTSCEYKGNSISPRLTFDDKLHISLYQHHMKKPLKIGVPVFELGTQGSPEKARDTILKRILNY